MEGHEEKEEEVKKKREFSSIQENKRTHIRFDDSNRNRARENVHRNVKNINSSNHSNHHRNHNNNNNVNDNNTNGHSTTKYQSKTYNTVHHNNREKENPFRYQRKGGDSKDFKGRNRNFDGKSQGKDPSKWFINGKEEERNHHQNEKKVFQYERGGHHDGRSESRSDLRHSLFQWEDFDVGELTNKFSVVSFNILSPTIAATSSELYPEYACPAECVDWRGRKERVVKDIHSLDADIVCLQELDANDVEWVQKRMETFGYLGLYKKRFGDKPDGCATFFKKSKFSLIMHKHVDYFRAKGWEWLDRDNVALILLLNPIGTNDYLCVANTHILFNKKRGDIKLAQLSVLMNEMNNIKLENPGFSNMSFIMCGDFNCTPQSKLIGFISDSRINLDKVNSSQLSGQRKGEHSPLPHFVKSSLLSLFPKEEHEEEENNTKLEVNEEMMEEKKVVRKKYEKKKTDPILSHPLNLRSAYHLDPNAISTFHRDGQIMVDYIWYSEDLERDGLRKVPTQLHLGAGLIGKGWPNVHQSSDHVPLMASFGWKRSTDDCEEEVEMTLN